MKYYIQTEEHVYESGNVRKDELESIRKVLESKGEKILVIAPVKGHHLCRYCGSLAEGDFEDLLCKDCRECFGHSLFTEL